MHGVPQSADRHNNAANNAMMDVAPTVRSAVLMALNILNRRHIGVAPARAGVGVGKEHL